MFFLLLSLNTELTKHYQLTSHYADRSACGFVGGRFYYFVPCVDILDGLSCCSLS